MNVGKFLSLFCFLSLLSTVLCVRDVSASPIVVIEPDTMITTNETVYCNGTGFQSNTSVRIDLVYPSGTVVEGVVSTTSDAIGSFSSIFNTPDLEGVGYIKAIVGNDTVSTIVTFVSTTSLTPDVSYSYDIYANQTAYFYINQQTLKNKNYIIDVSVINPDNQVINSFSVLHSGVCTVPLLFSTPGNHFINFSIEGTRYAWFHNVTVMTGTSQDNGGNVDTTNITWTEIQNKNSFTITLFKTDYGYVQSGSILVIDPDGVVTNTSILSGIATYVADKKGTYRLQFNDNGALYIDTFDYSPSALLSVTPFTSDGLTTITLKIDGTAPDEEVEIDVTSASGTNVVTLYDGTGTFTATTVGTYTFKLDYKGITSQITSSYSENYIVEEFSVSASEDGSFISVSGKVVGDKTGNGVPDARVGITCSELGFSTTVKTTASGVFRATITVPSGTGGRPISVSYEYNDDGETSMVMLKSDWIGGLWWLWVGILLIVLLFLWRSGTIYKYTKIFPPKGKAPARQDDGIWDDAFS